MISWKQSLKPSEMAQVASYLLTFQGTTPANPKAPEGDIWVDDSETVEQIVTDFKEPKTDSTLNVEEK